MYRGDFLLNNKDKCLIINQITETVYYCKSNINRKTDSILIYNTWSNSSNKKIEDICFLAELLNYIDDLILMDNSLLREVVKTIHK